MTVPPIKSPGQRRLGLSVVREDFRRTTSQFRHGSTFYDGRLRQSTSAFADATIKRFVTWHDGVGGKMFAGTRLGGTAQA